MPILAVVKTSSTSPDPVIIGFLTPFYPGRSLHSAITNSPTVLRLSYVRQLASVLAHVHHVGHTFHGDLKLENIVLKEKVNIILIDFEQMRPDEDASAPELSGAWDAHLDPLGRLVYTPYIGNHSKYESSSYYDAEENNWKPLEAWAKFPEAIERAEVYAFGVAAEAILLKRDGCLEEP
mgnify:CR=1 FL=1